MRQRSRATRLGRAALLCLFLQACGGGGGTPAVPGAGTAGNPGDEFAALPPPGHDFAPAPPPGGTLPAPPPPPPASPPPSACAVVDGAFPLVYTEAGACFSAQFRATHPRIALDAPRLALLRAKAGRLPDGSVGPAPSTDEHWNIVHPYLQAQAARTSGWDYGVEAWHFALAFAVTREAAFATRAIDFADRLVAARTSDTIGGPGDPRPCVARYPAGLPATDFAGAGSCLASGQFLYAHYYIKNVALVYDWLHDRLTPTQRADYRAYLRTAVDHMWNNRVDGAWAIDDPANNYHLGYLAGTVLQSLATWGEDSAAINNWNFLAAQKWPAEFRYLNGPAAGGYWHEGTHYGRKSKIDLAEILLWLRDASPARSLDLFAAPGFSFPREMLGYQLHGMQPDLFAKQGPGRYRGTGAYNVDANAPTFVQVGDLASNAQGPTTSADAGLMAMLSDGLAGQPAGAAAQFWLHDLAGGITRTRRARIHEFLYEDPARARQDYRGPGGLPLSAASAHWFHSRSDWTADATAVSFFSATGPQITSHQHRDQNSFLVWHKGWQAADLNAYGGSGLADDTAIHNTLLFNGAGQRTPILDPRFAANDPGYGRIAGTHISTAVPGLRAAIGDAANAYGEPENFGQNVRRTVQRFDRLLVHLGHIVVVADSVVGTAPGDVFTYMVHNRGTFTATADPRMFTASAPCGESMQSGAGCTDAMAGGRMVHATVLPQAAALRVRTGYSGRSSPSLPGSGLEFDAAGQAHVLVNAMAFGDRASTALPVADLLAGIAGFTGARVVHEGAALAVLLRDDPIGAPAAAVHFTLPGSGAHALLVSGLASGRYQVSVGGGAPVDAGTVGADGMLSLSIPAGSAIALQRVP